VRSLCVYVCCLGGGGYADDAIVEYASVNVSVQSNYVVGDVPNLTRELSEPPAYVSVPNLHEYISYRS
jgi:hypothetical protein